MFSMSFSLLAKSIKEELNYLICLTLLLLAWMGVAPTFYKAILTNDTIMLWLNKIFDLFDNNILLNIPICIFLIYLAYKIAKLINNHNVLIRLWNGLLVLFLYLLLYYKSPLDYANIIWILDYRSFFILLSILILFKNVYVYWKYKSAKKYIYIREFTTFIISLSTSFIISFIFIKVYGFRSQLMFPILFVFLITFLWLAWILSQFHLKDHWDRLYSWGFTPDYNEIINYPDSLRGYANEITERLLHTNLRNESFAVGITSEWGAGKTAFLRLLKKTINDSAEVVEFNPWMCRTPEQLTKDFFSSLSHQLSKRYSSLSHPIWKYAQYLNAISFPVSRYFSLGLSNIASEGSLYERKKKLSEKLLKLDKHIVVLIDDIDRLDREEVFEVLRLIRNTADLCNVSYIVAYDKDYVTSVLNEKHNIKDASIYMEKIFQIEIQLPMVLEDDIWNTFINDLETQLHDKTINLIFSDEEKTLIKSILNTYRRAKRFARLFSLNYSYLKARTVFLEWRDVFWLDMLQMHNKHIYNVLCSDRDKILDCVDGRLVLHVPYKIDMMDDKTIMILNQLWCTPSNPSAKNYGITYPDSYNKYFTLHFPLSEKEMERLVNSNDFETLEKASEERNMEYHHFWQILEEKLANKSFNKEQVESLIFVVLNICYHDNGYKIGYILRILKPIKYNLEGMSDSELFIRVEEWILKKLSKDGNRIILSAIVGECAEVNFLNRLHVQKLIQDIIQDYINKEDIAEHDLLNYNSNINMIIRYLYLHTSKCEYSGKDRRQDAFEYTIKTLSEKGKRFTIGKRISTIIKTEQHSTFEILYDEKWKENLEKIMKLCEDVPDVNLETEKDLVISNENHNHIEKTID